MLGSLHTTPHFTLFIAVGTKTPNTSFYARAHKKQVFSLITRRLKVPYPSPLPFWTGYRTDPGRVRERGESKSVRENALTERRGVQRQRSLVSFEGTVLPSQ